MCPLRAERRARGGSCAPRRSTAPSCGASCRSRGPIRGAEAGHEGHAVALDEDLDARRGACDLDPSRAVALALEGRPTKGLLQRRADHPRVDARGPALSHHGRVVGAEALRGFLAGIAARTAEAAQSRSASKPSRVTMVTTLSKSPVVIAIFAASLVKHAPCPAASDEVVPPGTTTTRRSCRSCPASMPTAAGPLTRARGTRAPPASVVASIRTSPPSQSAVSTLTRAPATARRRGRCPCRGADAGPAKHAVADLGRGHARRRSGVAAGARSRGRRRVRSRCVVAVDGGALGPHRAQPAPGPRRGRARRTPRARRARETSGRGSVSGTLRGSSVGAGHLGLPRTRARRLTVE